MSHTTLVLPNLANPAFPTYPDFIPEDMVLRAVRKLFVELETEVPLQTYACWMLDHSVAEFKSVQDEAELEFEAIVKMFTDDDTSNVIAPDDGIISSKHSPCALPSVGLFVLHPLQRLRVQASPAKALLSFVFKHRGGGLCNRYSGCV